MIEKTMRILESREREREKSKNDDDV